MVSDSEERLSILRKLNTDIYSVIELEAGMREKGDDASTAAYKIAIQKVLLRMIKQTISNKLILPEHLDTWLYAEAERIKTDAKSNSRTQIKYTTLIQQEILLEIARIEKQK